MSAASTLEVSTPHRWSRVAWILPLLALLAVVAWYATHPTALPAPQQATEATAPAGTPVYVGMFSADDRTLTVRGIDIEVEGGEASPLICRGGNLAVTTEATAFCTETVDAETGATLQPGDQLVLEVTGDAGATVAVQAPQVSFREGMQFGTSETGRPATITVLD